MVSTFPCRLLVDLPNWLGDFIHTVPALELLVKANRGGHTWALLPEGHAPIARVLGMEPIVRPRKASFRWFREILPGAFDLAITARHSTRAKLIVAASGATVRLTSRGRGGSTLATRSFVVDRRRHQRHDLDRALEIVALEAVGSGAARLPVTAAMQTIAERRRELLAAGDAPVVAIMPASRSFPEKRYPAARYVEVAQRLRSSGATSIVVVGPGEESLGWEVAERGGASLVPTSWPLDEIAALLAVCDAAVGNDSGLTHLAALAGCPTVALFGPTDPARTAPVGGATVIQAPIAAVLPTRRPIEGIPVEDVVRTVGDALVARRGCAVLAGQLQ